MTKRANVLAKLRMAGYHNDYNAFIRTYVGGRVAKQIADAEFQKGRKLKESGMKCNCDECMSVNCDLWKSPA